MHESARFPIHFNFENWLRFGGVFQYGISNGFKHYTTSANLTSDALTTGDLFDSEETFLKSIDFLVDIEEKYNCSNKCLISRSVSTCPMVDLTITSPNMFTTILNTTSNTNCDTCPPNQNLSYSFAEPDPGFII